jgi:hypothetical protein
MENGPPDENPSPHSVPVPLSKREPFSVILPGVSSVPQNATILMDGRQADGVNLVQTSDGVELRCAPDQCKQIPPGLHSIQSKVGNVAGNSVMVGYIWKDKLEKLAGIKPFGQSYAVVMAIRDYHSNSAFGDLDNAITQARELTSVLKKQGFQVKELYDADATKAKFEHYLFTELNPRLKEDDRILVYFGGHGFTKNDAIGKKAGFLVTWDATGANIEEKGILMNNVEEGYETLLRARHVFFVLDACFAGIAARETPPDESDLLRFQTLLELDSLSEKSSHSVFAAGGDEQPAVDNSGGIFTTAFIDGIQGGADLAHSGIVTEWQLVDYVQRVVRAEAARHLYDQEPKYSAPNLLGHGQFVFVYR